MDNPFADRFRGDKEWFTEHFGYGYKPHKSAVCHTCAHKHNLARRTLNSGMAKGLAVMYREGGTQWQTIASTRWREEPKLAWWGLLRSADERGRHRVTGKGELWLMGEIAVPKWAVVLDNTCLMIEGDPVSYQEALGRPFDFDAFMRGE
jgi:hypothetical protein